MGESEGKARMLPIVLNAYILTNNSSVRKAENRSSSFSWLGKVFRRNQQEKQHDQISRVMKTLANIQQRYNVRILYATEVASTEWSAPESSPPAVNYLTRFVYVRNNVRSYLTLNDTIAGTSVLDSSNDTSSDHSTNWIGFDVSKALRMAHQFDPVIVDMIYASNVYELKQNVHDAAFVTQVRAMLESPDRISQLVTKWIKEALPHFNKIVKEKEAENDTHASAPVAGPVCANGVCYINFDLDLHQESSDFKAPRAKAPQKVAVNDYLALVKPLLLIERVLFQHGKKKQNSNASGTTSNTISSILVELRGHLPNDVSDQISNLVKHDNKSEQVPHIACVDDWVGRTLDKAYAFAGIKDTLILPTSSFGSIADYDALLHKILEVEFKSK